MQQVHVFLVNYLGNRQRLMAIALLWFVTIYAPVACIIHCHFFSAHWSTAQQLREFHCDLLHGAPTSHQHEGHGSHGASLPRILYDAMILLLLLLPSLSLLAKLEPPLLNWPLHPRFAPIPPPPR